MTETTKKAIAQLVKQACDREGSQSKWGTKYEISTATVSNIVNGKWALIADKMWNRAGAAVHFQGQEWQTARTADFLLVLECCTIAQREGVSLALSHDAGGGKTHALKEYASAHKNVVYIQCAEYWTKKLFLSNIYRALGKDPAVMSGPELADGIIAELRQRSKPLMIIDEVDKLRDPLLMYFIELYNKLDGMCGFLHVGAPYLRIAWEKSAKRDKRGFRELYSRIGRRFLHMNGVKRKDVALICNANGVTDEAEVNAVWNAVEESKDLRRVRREIEKLRYEKNPLGMVG